MLATRPVDFRRGAHSLAALAAASLGQDPFDGYRCAGATS
jgi:transposase